MNNATDASTVTCVQHASGAGYRDPTHFTVRNPNRPARHAGSDRGQLAAATRADSRRVHDEIRPDEQFLPVTGMGDVGHDDAGTTADVYRHNVVAASAELVHDRVPDESPGAGDHRASHVAPSHPWDLPDRSPVPGISLPGRSIHDPPGSPPGRHPDTSRSIRIGLTYRHAEHADGSLRSHDIDPT